MTVHVIVFTKVSEPMRRALLVSFCLAMLLPLFGVSAGMKLDQEPPFNIFVGDLVTISLNEKARWTIDIGKKEDIEFQDGYNSKKLVYQITIKILRYGKFMIKAVNKDGATKKIPIHVTKPKITGDAISLVEKDKGIQGILPTSQITEIFKIIYNVSDINDGVLLVNEFTVEIDQPEYIRKVYLIRNDHDDEFFLNSISGEFPPDQFEIVAEMNVGEDEQKVTLSPSEDLKINYINSDNDEVDSVCGKRSLSEEGSCFFAGHTIRIQVSLDRSPQK
jgi:hypothetical protein